HRMRGTRETPEHVLVELQGGMARGRPIAYGKIDLAPCKARGDPLADHGFELAQVVGQAQPEVQGAMVDRAQLDAERGVVGFSLDTREGGHAADHAERLRNGTRSMPRMREAPASLRTVGARQRNTQAA